MSARLPRPLRLLATGGLVSLCALSIGGSAFAATLAVERARDAATIVLGFPQAVSVRPLREGRDLLLTFDQPLGETPLDGLMERLGGLAENVRYGYDTLLLTLPTAVVAEVTGHDRQVTVTLTGSAALSAEDTEREAQAQRRVEFFQAVTLLEAGEPDIARARLARLVDSEPDNVELIVALAQAEERLGRWQKAVALYDRALTLDPDETATIGAKARLLAEHGNHVRVEPSFRDTRNADRQWVMRVIARANLNDTVTAGATFERRRLTISQLRHSDGSVRDFSGWRSMGELWLSRDWAEGDRTTVGALGNEKRPGVRLAHRIGRPEQTTTFVAALSEPTMDYAEAIAEHGSRHRAGAAHGRDLAPDLRLELAAFGNRYALANDLDVATTASATAGLRWAVVPGLPLVTLGYTIDAEYLIERDERTSPLGEAYSPLPVTSREVHSVDVTFEDRLTDYLSWRADAGYGYDRLNDRGPNAGVGLIYAPLVDLEAELALRRTFASGRGQSNAVTIVGGHLHWRY